MTAGRCLSCDLPFGGDRLRPIAGWAVGIAGEIHLRCYHRLHAQQTRERRGYRRRDGAVPAPLPATGYRAPRVTSRPWQATKAPPVAPPTLLDEVCRIDEREPAAACRRMVELTRGVFGTSA